ncbi:MAG: hypothetical protein Kow0029_23900 [Candidatus Rifleibacteriota bacterium]
MSKRGFTLIELMIVIAILGIMTEAMWAPTRILFDLEESSDEFLDRNQQYMQNFLELQRFNASLSEISSSTDTRVEFANGSKLILDKDNKEIVLENGNQKTRVKGIKFEGSIKCHDKKTYSFKILLNNEPLVSYWRCGK